MNHIFADFQFLRPSFLYLLIFVIMACFLTKGILSSSNAWEKICDKPLFQYLMGTKQNGKRKNFNFWICLGFLSAVIAIAGPSFTKKTEPVVEKENPLMIVLDLSTDMNKFNTSVPKLSRAKIEITDILQKAQTAPAGLIVYTYEPFLISPLAYDPNIIINLLPVLNTKIMPLDGNKLDRALELALSRFTDNAYAKGNILVITGDIPLDFDKSLDVARQAAKKGYHVSAYGLSARPNPKLQELASAGNGIYSGVQYASSEKLIDFLSSDGIETSETSNFKIVAQDNGFWFVVICLVCLLALFPRGMLIFIVFLSMTHPAYAGFLFSQNQEGALMFSSKEYAKASEKFTDDAWKASALYKAGDYAGALKLLEGKTDVTSLYNKGNALAKSGQIAEAIKTYEDVLKKQPDHEDAKFNLEYLKSMPQQNKQQQNQQNRQQKQSDEQNNQNSAPQDNDSQNENENAAENNQNDNDEQNESDQPQNQNQSTGEENNDDKSDQTSEEENQEKNNQDADKNKEREQAPSMAAKEEAAQQYDETVQAREQKFRTIKENPGGLLKAFMQEEYLKKRYPK